MADEVRLKRLARYVAAHPRGEFLFKWQPPVDGLTCYVDSDWAGCVRTRKSTSGGVVLRGGHCLHHWSRTQANIALSSGEAELNSALKGGCELAGACEMVREISGPVEADLYGDSSACHGTLHREGAGKVKHLEVKQLWLQDRIKKGLMRYTKIAREFNPSDSLAKAWGKDGVGHFAKLGFWAS